MIARSISMAILVCIATTDLNAGNKSSSLSSPAKSTSAPNNYKSTLKNDPQLMKDLGAAAYETKLDPEAYQNVINSFMPITQALSNNIIVAHDVKMAAARQIVLYVSINPTLTVATTEHLGNVNNWQAQGGWGKLRDAINAYNEKLSSGVDASNNTALEQNKKTILEIMNIPVQNNKEEQKQD